MKKSSKFLAVFCLLLCLKSICWSFSGPQSGFDVALVTSPSVTTLMPNNTIVFSINLGGTGCNANHTQPLIHSITLSGPNGNIGIFNVTCTINNGVHVLNSPSPTTIQKTLSQLGITSAGEKTFTLSYTKDGQPTSSTAKVWIGSISKLQYKEDAIWKDVSGTMYLPKDKTISLKAIPVSPNNTFPYGQPTWGGTSGATGYGEEISLTPGAIGNKTIIVTCGNTITINIIVYELIPVTTPLDNFTNRSNDKYGLNERVNLNYNTNPGVLLSNIGGLAWSHSGGSHIDNSPGNDGTGIFIAGSDSGDVTLNLKVMSGPAKGQIVSVNRSIVSPSYGSINQSTVQTNVYHVENKLGVGFKGYIYIGPSDVSFNRLYFKEGTCNATADGSFSTKNNESHVETASWLSILYGDNTTAGRTGSRVYTTDTISSEVYWTDQQTGNIILPKPIPDTIYEGHFTWDIPWKYKAEKNDGTEVINNFYIAEHYAEAGSNAWITLRKANSGPYSAYITDPTQNY